MSITLMQHQQRAVEIGRVEPRYGFGWAPGCGKTIAVLSVIEDAKHRGFSGKTAVLAPKGILECAWAEDVRKMEDLRATVCWSNSRDKRRKLIETKDADILVMNYALFKSHVDDLHNAGVKRLVIDESSAIKSNATDITKACHEFSDRMDSVYLMSGTPAPNSPTEYFSQMRCIDRSIFGGNFWKFAFWFFIPQKRWTGDRERIVGWTMNKSREADFIERLRRKWWSLSKEECLDLPEQVDVLRQVELSSVERRAYDSMRDELKLEFDGETFDANIMARAMKLRQLTGGMMYGADGIAIHTGRSKLDEMLAILEEIGGRNVVIWAQFTEDIDRIISELGHRKVGRLDSKTKMQDRPSIIERFQRRELDTIVAHPQAAGHGATLTAAPYSIDYDHSFSFELYDQSRGRIHRIGQTEKCTYFHLSAKDTIDEKILYCLKHHQSVHDAIRMALSFAGSDEAQDDPRMQMLRKME